MSYLGQENLILTVPNPAALGPLADTINITNVTATNITTTSINISGPIAFGGVGLATATNIAGTAASVTAQTPSANAALALVPQGTGAITTAVPDNTAVGGNARGTGAIDLQIQRGAATQVASGNNSALIGGTNNTASGAVSAVIGGSLNTAAAAASCIIAGNNNNINATSTRSIIAGTFNGCSNSVDTVLIGTVLSANNASNSVLVGTQITCTNANNIMLNTGLTNIPSQGDYRVQIEGSILDLTTHQLGGDLTTDRIIHKNSAGVIQAFTKFGQVKTTLDNTFEPFMSIPIASSTSCNITVQGVVVNAAGLTSTFCFRTWARCDAVGTVTVDGSGASPITNFTAAWNGSFGGTSENIGGLNIQTVPAGPNFMQIQMLSNPGTGAGVTKWSARVDGEYIAWGF